MTIKDWPVDERPREKLLTHGAQALSPAELLSVLLAAARAVAVRSILAARCSPTPAA